MRDDGPTKDERRRPRPFVLCADDYALTPAVSRGVLRLLDRRRITATGAMTNRPHWPALAGELKGFAAAADLGVHLNLTCGAPLGAMPTVAPDGRLPAIGGLARLAFFSAVARREIAAEIGRQLDAFEEAMGRAPDFVDGHQHAHALPGIGPALAALLARRYGAASGFYARDPADRLGAILARPAAGKALAVTLLGRGLGPALRRAGLKTNAGFSGYSAFDPTADYAAEFAGALRRPGPAHLIMCHPGEVDDELRGLDPVIETRPRELAFFESEGAHSACAAANMTLARMVDVFAGRNAASKD
jgi:predicted glycoside hydrolase/deacetylase ChbG (UPF0249 family)